jgi:hypothetical protein
MKMQMTEKSSLDERAKDRVMCFNKYTDFYKATIKMLMPTA